MKAQMLKMAGVKTEAAFYKKFPTQEAFMKVHGKAFKKAQIGTYIGGDKAAPIKPINFKDMYDEADLSVTGKTDDMRKEEMYKQASLAADQKVASGNSGDMFSQIGSALGSLGEGFGGEAEYGAYIPKAQIGRNLAPIGQNLQPAGMVNVGPQVGQPQSFNVSPLPNQVNPAQSATMGKIGDAIGKYAGPAGQVLQGISALKAEKKALKSAQQMQQVSDLALKASNTRPEQSQRRYVRPEDMVTAGNQVSPAQGTGTNVLAQKGVTVSGKPISKKDVRKEKDVIKVLPSSSLYPEEEANYIRTTKSLKGLGKRDNKLEQQASDDFVDWYQHPETLKRFGENTGMDPARLKDFVGKALRTPVRPAKEDDYLRSEDNAQWRSPFWQDQNYRTLNKDTGEILYDSNATPNIIQHEFTHASNLDEVLGPKLMNILGKPTNVFRSEKAYIGRPTEAYGNFHEFRTNLGLKPGQKIDEATLKKLTKKKGLDQERFYRAYSPDKIAKAINTIAYNNEDGDVTYAQDGAEIQNTYAPDTLYDDLGYEPLEDSAQIKQYQTGGAVPWDIVGQAGSDIGGAIVGQDAGSNIGGTIGGTIGTAIGGPLGGAIGKTLGTVAGGLLDTNDRDMRKAQKATSRNMQGMAFNNGVQSLQAGNAAYMEDGGYVSNDWNPQVIAKFGDHSAEDVYDFAHEGMKSFRAGGHLKSYTPPSERAMETYAMGGDVSNFNLGEVEVESGGYLQPISYNPYNDGTGVTSMIKGQSHDEYNSKLGHSGVILNAYGNQVEAERGEPIREMEEGGSLGNDKSAVITGNLVYKNINNIMDPKYKKYEGEKIKNIHKKIALKDQKLNKLEEKNTNKLVEIDPKTSIDKLEFATLQANDLGYKMQYKNNAKDADYFTNHQTIINNTAEEFGLDADSLAKGKVKTAKTGGQFTKAQVGGWYEKNKPLFMTDSTDNKVDMDAGELNEVKIPAKKIDYMRRAITSLSPKGIVEPDMTPRGSVVPDSAGMLANEYEASNKPAGSKIHNYSWIEALNSVIPNLRPSDAEDLNANQLLGEMYALSQNQEEPVQAQLFSPELASPYSISLQDQMNEITAQTRAAQRMAGNNPAAQAAIAAQAYEAINKVKGEEFRMNQALADKVYTGNIAAINDAKLKNLGILDQQYTRQATAKSNTKAVAQAALNSISDKYAKNALENKTLKTYENMYNYRYDANGRLINMNPLAQFDTSGINSSKSLGKDVAPEGYEFETVLKKKKATAKNGSIVKAMRNL